MLITALGASGVAAAAFTHLTGRRVCVPVRSSRSVGNFSLTDEP